MQNINTKKIGYYLKTKLFSTNNAIIAFALLLAISWAWGAVGVMERNYNLQRELATKERQLKLVELERDTLEYQTKYHQSDEYKELAVRQRLGLAFPDEKSLILPPNSRAASRWDAQQERDTRETRSFVQPSNTQQWIDLLTGANVRNMQLNQ
ncbi:hypothetical protein H6796_03075 [Candidatus Nomurabacteria bacterium]|nr:hypothetical protein [Candidatus Nomurabacteria bacterium]